MWKLTMVFMCYFLQANFIDSVSGLPTHFSVGSKHNPGKSCSDIKARGGTATGTYYIRLNGHTAKVYCDQTTAGGGWTLVYSFSFAEGVKVITPRPSWPLYGESVLSTTTPQSESDLNAMDFNLWKELGSEIMIKSSVNNWITCEDGTGSLVHWRSGSLKCKIIKKIFGICGEVVPNSIMVDYYWSGPNIYDNRVNGIIWQTYYYFDTWITGEELPSFDPCGDGTHYSTDEKSRGTLYIR